MAHVSDKVKVNMLLMWCGPDGEDIYEGFNLDDHQLYDLELIWSLFDKHCEPICNFFVLQGGNFILLLKLHLKLLTLSTIGY